MRAACRVRVWATIVTTGLGVFGASVARAQVDSVGPSPVVTTVDPCVPLDLAHFRRLLGIELGTSIDYQVDAPLEPGRTWVHLTCLPEGITLQLQDGVTHKSMMRVLDVAQIAPAERTRLLALAVAEFVVASWVELRAVPEPSVPAVGALAEPEPDPIVTATLDKRLAEVIPQQTAARQAWEVALGGGFETFTSHAAILPTVSLRLLQSAVPPLAFLIGGDLGILTVPVTRDDRQIATIEVTRASGLAALLYGGELADFMLWAGIGVRFGIVRMSGRTMLDSLTELEFVDPHGGPLVVARAGYRLAEHFAIGAELELGAVTLPVEASVMEDLLLRIGGAWFAGGVRASFLF